MPGVRGRSGPPDVPKSAEHRAKIAEAMRRYWASEEGRAERRLRQEISREIRRRRAAGEEV